ncbi:hypothetical protein PVAP13_2KG500005 [Panicum virgatum]|uniref:Uncharacterized protein n=1 Tax=Panicum virgatum TaxID=38727 RepID=A0A8T0WJR9_PANVG|nr:hypothetical protein PVAP13_2KG500005 [Panicum virgatum]
MLGLKVTSSSRQPRFLATGAHDADTHPAARIRKPPSSRPPTGSIPLRPGGGRPGRTPSSRGSRRRRRFYLSARFSVVPGVHEISAPLLSPTGGREEDRDARSRRGGLPLLAEVAVRRRR